MSASSDPQTERDTEQTGARPLVSVVVPVYNGERFLRESLDSILGQTYSNVEVLVVDDASTDGTAAVIESYGNRVRLYRQSQNRGIYGNMNDGIARVNGEFIAIYHADDVYDPQIIEREVEFLQRFPEAGAVFCSDIFIGPTGAERGRLVLPPEIRGGRPLQYATVLNALLKYKNRFLRCPSCMARAEVYRDMGVYREQQFRNTSDLDMYLRMARARPIGVIEDYLFRYRWGHGNSGQRYKHLRTDEERFFPIMDLYLAEGGRAIATPEALAGFGAHRAEDGIMRAVNLYITGRIDEARQVLKNARFGRLLASPQVQRGRLCVLLMLLHVLVRLPRLPMVASLFRRRWHAGA